MANGTTRLAIGWTGVIVTAAMGFLQFITGFHEATWACCGFFVIFLFILNSGSEAKKKVTLLVNAPQKPPPQVIHHTHVHHQTPQSNSTSTPSRFNQPVGTAIQWETEARNLELARDWEKAAAAYQKAGLYSEAGRVRKDHLEKEDSQVKIHVDRIGHNIQDSVYMDESNSKKE